MRAFTEGLPEGHIAADISDAAAASSAAHSLHGAACGTARCGATVVWAPPQKSKASLKGVTGRWPAFPMGGLTINDIAAFVTLALLLALVLVLLLR